MRAETLNERNFISRKFFDGGGFLIRQEGQWKKATAVRGNGENLSVSITQYPEGLTRVIPWRDVEVDSITFTPQLMWHSNILGVVKRNTRTTTQRSLSPLELEFFPLVLKLFDPKKAELRSNGFITIESFLSQLDELNPLSLEAAVEQFSASPDSQESSVEERLSPLFALTLSLNSKDPRYWLWHLETPVALVDGNKRRISVMVKDFRQEVFDYLNRTNQQDWSLDA